MRILGISAIYHDSTAALIRDREIVAATQQERFSRKEEQDRDMQVTANPVSGRNGTGLESGHAEST